MLDKFEMAKVKIKALEEAYRSIETARTYAFGEYDLDANSYKEPKGDESNIAGWRFMGELLDYIESKI